MVDRVSITDQRTGEPLQERFGMLKRSCLLVIVQNDRMPLIVFSCPIYPHIRFGAGFSSILRHIDRGLIALDDVPAQKFTVHLIIYQRQIPFRRPVHPVRHCGITQHNTTPFKLFPDPVQRHGICIFPIHDRSNQGGGSQTVVQQFCGMSGLNDCGPIFPTVNGDMVFYNLISGRNCLHLAIHLVREPLPALFAKDALELLIGKFMRYDFLGKILDILFPLSFRARFPLRRDFLDSGFRNRIICGSLNLVKKGDLSFQIQLLAAAAKSCGLCHSQLFAHEDILLLYTQNHGDELLLAEIVQLIRRKHLHDSVPLSAGTTEIIPYFNAYRHFCLNLDSA